MTEERKQRTDVRSQRTEYRKSYWLLVIGLNGVSGVRQFFYLTKPVLDYISFVEFLYNVVRKRRIEIISNNYLAFGRSWFAILDWFFKRHDFGHGFARFGNNNLLSCNYLID